jgi:DNA mismatch endonuclease (patch repair protein)
MRANRNISGTEVRFRRALWAAGARGFRRGSYLRGRPDIVFPALRIAIQIYGCYWHSCPTCRLPQPKANAAFWRAKFHANVQRDRLVEDDLVREGWTVIVIWEHEIRRDPTPMAEHVAHLVEVARRAA